MEKTMQTSEATAGELRDVLESLRIIQVSELYPGDDHVLMYCRLNETQMDRWARFVEAALRREVQVNKLSGQDVVRMEFSRQYRLIGEKFGYSWKVFIWAGDVSGVAGILRDCVGVPAQQQATRQPPKQPPVQRDVVGLPHRAGNRNDPTGKMVEGAMGRQIPSEKGAYGKRT